MYSNTYNETSSQLKPYGETLNAKKSWFMFDDEIVALGSDICAGDNKHIETVVDNRKLNASGDNALTVNGTAKPAAPGWTETMKDVQWIHLAGNVTGFDIGWPQGAMTILSPILVGASNANVWSTCLGVCGL